MPDLIIKGLVSNLWARIIVLSFSVSFCFYFFFSVSFPSNVFPESVGQNEKDEKTWPQEGPVP